MPSVPAPPTTPTGSQGDPGDRHSEVPAHIAIIMDGNGRWAKQRGLPRIEGHRRGVETVRQITIAAKKLGAQVLTLYAFSVENWKRPQDEVGGLMGLLEFYLKRELKTFVRDRVRFQTIGRIDELPPGIRNLLLRHGGKDQGVRRITRLSWPSTTVRGPRWWTPPAAMPPPSPPAGKSSTTALGYLPKYLYTADTPDPDLVIRTSGEARISNFLLMQAAYAELVFTPVLWPDFTKDDLAAAIAEFARRERRYGLTSEQLRPAAEVQ